MATDKRSNWLEKNPKKIIALLILIVIIIVTYSTEKLLGYINKGIGFNFALKHRAIFLREYHPLMTEYNYPPKESDVYDTLIKKHYLLRVDGNGFIMPSERHSNPDMSLVFLGASTTACLEVEEENRFPYVAGLLLEKDLGIRINSYNASRTGNHTLHSIDVLLNKIIPMKPDIVVMMHNNNDIAILLYEKSYWNNHPTRSLIFDVNEEISRTFFKYWRDRLIPNIAREFRTVQLKVKALFNPDGKTGRDNDEFATKREKKISFDRAAMVEQFEMNLDKFIAICKIRKITPVLLTMASRLTENPDENIQNRFKNVVVSYDDYMNLFRMFNESIRKKGREHHIVVIDLAATIPPVKEYIYDVIHFNDRGSIKAAEIIRDHLHPLVRERLAGKRAHQQHNSAAKP